MGLFRKQHDDSIDLREPAEASSPLAWGAPAPCPECGGPGYLDGIDPGRVTMYQHCTECWHKYEITEAQVEASNA